MPIRNPFARRPGTAAVSDENARPVSSSGDALQAPGFERADTVGSKASSALSIRSQDNGEYKMSGMRRRARRPRLQRGCLADASYGSGQ
jgi:hypothetical protein